VNQRRIGIASLAIALLIVVAAIAWYALRPSRALRTASQAPVVGKAQLGQTAPQFEVATTDGLFDLDKAGKPVFLEIFATWCPHCRHEIPAIDRLYERYRSRVDFVGVSGSTTGMDGTSAESAADVVAWAQRFGVRYPVAYDPLLNVAGLYLQGGFPTIAIIGKDKKIAYLTSGETSYGDLNSALQRVLHRSLE
jgi:thiol-disulfide isomerase/thioredoxin